jgi:hypothetical protein
MLPLTGAKLSVVMLSLRAFGLYYALIVVCQILISGKSSQDTGFWHPLSYFANAKTTGFCACKRGDRGKPNPS